MAQPLQNTASTRRAPKVVAVALPSEVKELAGVAAIVTYTRLVKDFEEVKKALLEAARPAIDALFALGAADQTKLADVVRTYMTKEDQVTAQVQLKAKNIKKLGIPEAQILNMAKIPLRTVPGRKVVNPLYAGAGEAEGPQAVLVAEVIKALTTLIEANPNSGVPADIFYQAPSINLPVEDALLRALKLPIDQRAAPLAILSDIAVIGGEMKSVDPLIDALNKQIDAIKDKDKAAS